MASKVELELVALTRKAGADIERFGSGASATLKAVGAVAAGALAVFASKKVLGAIGDVTAAAAKQEDAVNSLNSALKLAGDFSVGASEDLQRFASDMQSVTTIGDETTIKMLALAKSFGVSNEGAKSLVSAAADLSEVTGMSLDSAVRNLGKTYGGLTGELGEVIPALKDLTTEQLKSGAAIKFVTERFGGAATAATNTYSGAMAQLSNAFGDFQEELGFIITKNPAVIKGIQLLKTAFERISTVISENRKGLTDLITDGIGALLDTFPYLVRGLAFPLKSIQGLILVTGTWLEFNFRLIDSFLEFEIINKVLNGVFDTYKTIFAGMVGVVQTLVEALEKIPGASSAIKGLTGQDFGEIKQQLEGIGIAAAGSIGDDTVSKFRDKIGEMRTGVTEFVDASEEKFGTLNTVVDGAVDAVSGLGDKVRDLKDLSKDPIEFDVKVAQPGDKNFMGPVKPGAEPETVPGLPSGAFNFSDSPIFKFFEELENVGKALLTSLGQNITKGRQGANAVIGAGVGASAEALLPGAGQFVGPIITELAGATKEEARTMAEEFAAGIPAAIDALVQNIPIFIETLAENSGEIITALVSASPQITIALAKSMPVVARALIGELVAGFKYQLETLGPRFAEFGNNFSEGFNNATQALVEGVTNFPQAFGEQMPKVGEKFSKAIAGAGPKLISGLKEGLVDGFAKAGKAFLGALSSGLKELLEDITPGFLKKGGGGGGGNGYTPFAKKPTPTNPFGMGATGGMVGGVGNKDNQAFALMPGELIIDKQRTSRLDKAIDNLEGNGMSEVVALLARILAAVSSTQTVQSEVRFNERVLADIILQLNKANARLTA